MKTVRSLLALMALAGLLPLAGCAEKDATAPTTTPEASAPAPSAPATAAPAASPATTASE